MENTVKYKERELKEIKKKYKQKRKEVRKRQIEEYEQENIFKLLLISNRNI